MLGKGVIFLKFDSFNKAKHIALEKNIPSDINECQINDTHDLSDNNIAV